jgi:hypothetical protein
MVSYLSFRDVATRMQSRDSRIQQLLPYTNRHWIEGTTIGFSHFCEWFEVNIHNAKTLSPERALQLLESSPETLLDSSDTDDYGNVRWFGGAWIGPQHVRVWWNPRAL